MNRDELAALHDALEAVLAWPDNVRAEVARWLAPEAAKPNGRDPHPPPMASVSDSSGALGRTAPERTEGPLRRSPTPRQAAPAPRPAKVRQGAPFNTKAAEQRLLTALQEHSGSTVIVLARAASSSRSSTGERLRGLAARGLVTKDAGGHWRLVAELAGEEARPTEAPSN